VLRQRLPSSLTLWQNQFSNPRLSPLSQLLSVIYNSSLSSSLGICFHRCNCIVLHLFTSLAVLFVLQKVSRNHPNFAYSWAYEIHTIAHHKCVMYSMYYA